VEDVSEGDQGFEPLIEFSLLTLGNVDVKVDAGVRGDEIPAYVDVMRNAEDLVELLAVVILHLILHVYWRYTLRLRGGAVSPSAICLHMDGLRPNPSRLQARTERYSASVAERLCLKISRLTRRRSWPKRLWTEAWTELHFCKVFIRRKRAIDKPFP
jgi:hypothetical protein